MRQETALKKVAKAKGIKEDKPAAGAGAGAGVGAGAGAGAGAGGAGAGGGGVLAGRRTAAKAPTYADPADDPHIFDLDFYLCVDVKSCVCARMMGPQRTHCRCVLLTQAPQPPPGHHLVSAFVPYVAFSRRRSHLSVSHRMTLPVVRLKRKPKPSKLEVRRCLAARLLSARV